MAWTINWTQSAWNDLEAAANYISKDSPDMSLPLFRKFEMPPGR